MKRRLVQVGIVIIGDEILQGRRPDKHFSHTRDYFGRIGVDLAWVYYLGDNEQNLVDSFAAIRRSEEVCFTFGGIGATPDDRTRQAMAGAHDLPITRHPEARKLIENQFLEAAYPNRILMADLPEGAQLIPNHFNNIPGFSIGDIHCLPGFPEMAWPMLEWVVQTKYDTKQIPERYFQALIVPGAKESELITIQQDFLARFPEVALSSLPRFPAHGRWQVELGLRGARDTVQAGAVFLREELLKRGFEVAVSA